MFLSNEGGYKNVLHFKYLDGVVFTSSAIPSPITFF